MTRTDTIANVAFRAAGPASAEVVGSKRIVGRACPYDVVSAEMGGVRELYQPGCFAASLRTDDVFCTFNLDDCRVLGRKSAGTCFFFEQADGLYYDCEPPRTSWADDLLISMGRGDITQSGVQFWTGEASLTYQDSGRVRVIRSARLRATSVVTFQSVFPDATSASVKAAAQNSLLAASLASPRFAGAIRRIS